MPPSDDVEDADEAERRPLVEQQRLEPAHVHYRQQQGTEMVVLAASASRPSSTSRSSSAAAAPTVTTFSDRIAEPRVLLTPAASPTHGARMPRVPCSSSRRLVPSSRFLCEASYLLWLYVPVLLLFLILIFLLNVSMLACLVVGNFLVLLKFWPWGQSSFVSRTVILRLAGYACLIMPLNYELFTLFREYEEDFSAYERLYGPRYDWNARMPQVGEKGHQFFRFELPLSYNAAMQELNKKFNPGRHEELRSIPMELTSPFTGEILKLDILLSVEPGGEGWYCLAESDAIMAYDYFEAFLLGHRDRQGEFSVQLTIVQHFHSHTYWEPDNLAVLCRTRTLSWKNRLLLRAMRYSWTMRYRRTIASFLLLRFMDGVHRFSFDGDGGCTRAGRLCNWIHFTGNKAAAIADAIRWYSEHPRVSLLV